MKFLALFLYSISCWAFDSNEIRIQLSGEPSSLDPLHVSDVLGFSIASNLNLGLVKLDSSGKLVNGLAKSFKISKDGKIYTFQIDPKAKWSDGKPVSVSDCIFGLNLTLNPKSAARDAPLLSSIKEIIEENKSLVIILKNPDASFLPALTMPMAVPRRKDIWDANGGKWKAEDPTTGKFRVKLFKPDHEIQLEPNPFTNVSKVKIVYKVIPEETTALNLFETGNLDLLTTVPSLEYARLEKEKLVQVDKSAAAFYLAFNLSKAPFNELRWRRAIASSINREGLAKLQPGSFTPTISYLPSSINGFIPYELKKNTREVDWAKKQHELTVPLVYAQSALSNLMLQRVQAELGEKLPLKIKLEPMEWKAYLGRMTGDAPAFFYMGYSAPFSDPAGHLKIFLTGDSENRFRYSNKKYDDLVKKIKSAQSAKDGTGLAQKAQEILIFEDTAIIPLLERNQIHGVSKRLKGFRVNPFGVVDLESLRL